jgi:SpoVK/Ycf46/Vps4 family AAA+-type ATPase
MSNSNPPNKKNNKKKRVIHISSEEDSPPPKRTIVRKPHIYFDDNDDELDLINTILGLNYQEEDKRELVTIVKEIKNLQDLIDLGKMYDITKRYNIDLETLNKLVDPLTELNNMIGMENVKEDMVDHILFKIQKLDETNNDMMHTVIQGPPGVGKTELAKIIGKIYLAMGILRNDVFIKATRSNLIAGYLGQTAKATQKIIDSASGGILFIDEVYSLGNTEKRDSFSKECIDTINENLTSLRTDFICIIAGYKEEIASCFFSYNPGLERRFPVRFTIEPYNANDVFLIFKKKILDGGWEMNESITINFFNNNFEYFKYFGGDMEILFSRCKRAHSRRVFGADETQKKILNITDLKKGFETFKNHREEKKEKDESWKNMYV